MDWDVYHWLFLVFLAFELDYTTGSPGSPAYRQQIVGFLSFHNFVIQFFITKYKVYIHSTPGGSEVKNPSANAGDAGSVPESGRFPGEGNGNPL